MTADIKAIVHPSKIAEEFSALLSQKFKELSMVLFGSAARGGGIAEGDVDILVLANDDVVKGVEEEALNVSFELTVKNGVFVQVLTMDFNEFETLLKFGSPLAFEVIYDGKLVSDYDDRFSKLREAWGKILRRRVFFVEGSRVAKYEVARA